MSTGGGAATTSATTTAAPSTSTHQRRRGGDAMSDPSDSLDNDTSDADSETFNSSSNNANLHQRHHHYHHHPAIRYALIRRRVPEKWALRVEGCVSCVTSRVHVGRKAIVALLIMVALLAYFRFLFLMTDGGGGGGPDEVAGDFIRTEREKAIIHNFKNDLSSNAQNAVLEDSGSSSNSASVVQKRRMKEFPVS